MYFRKNMGRRPTTHPYATSWSWGKKTRKKTISTRKEYSGECEWLTVYIIPCMRGGDMYKIRQWNHCRWRFGICFLELFIEDVRLDRLVLLGWVETTKGKLASFGTGRIMGCVKCVLGICWVFFLKDVNGIARYCCWDMHMTFSHCWAKDSFAKQFSLSKKVVNLLAGDQ